MINDANHDTESNINYHSSQVKICSHTIYPDCTSQISDYGTSIAQRKIQHSRNVFDCHHHKAAVVTLHIACLILAIIYLNFRLLIWFIMPHQGLVDKF